jgi:hypothetical protein
MELISHTTGSDLGRELEIANGAAARCGEEKEERKRAVIKRKGGNVLFCAGVVPIDMARLTLTSITTGNRVKSVGQKPIPLL